MLQLGVQTDISSKLLASFVPSSSQLKKLFHWKSTGFQINNNTDKNEVAESKDERNFDSCQGINVSSMSHEWRPRSFKLSGRQTVDQQQKQKQFC